MTNVLNDVNQDPLIIGNKYLILPKKTERESISAYSMRKDNTKSNGVYTVEKVEPYGDHMEAWCSRDGDNSRWFGNLIYEFNPINGGRRRKSRRLRKRFRKTRK